MWWAWLIAFALAFAMLLPIAMRFKTNANNVAVGGKTYKIA